MKDTSTTNIEEKSEAERFIDFTRKIMSAPKEEIDEQQRIYDREKQKRKKSKKQLVELAYISDDAVR